MNFHHTKIFGIILLGASSLAHAKSLPIDCPANINVSQALVDTPAGWKQFKPDFPHYLSGVEMFDGAPEEQAALKPDVQKHQKTIWHFQSSSIKYVVCKYSYTSIQLTQALPASVKSCTVKFKPYALSEGGNPIPEKILCQ